ncbi:MAG TPA: UDP-glucose/GDP-mannose dehydrogenase family protein, partial [Candidatus Nanoarchaeia archaeon]|nr:UDP-glucose/GDP-mannose dehydrogenase family protein [Candidatus Nanoarchaeia archaeon]
MKIAVIGCGYVGLVTGASLANLGNDVICVDIDDEKIADLRKGIIPFFEPGLRDLVEMNLSQKRLMFTTDSELAIRNSDIVFVAVGTPSNADGKADLSAVFAVAEHIARYIDAYKVIVMKSTVPVGTCHKLRDLIRQKMKKPVEFDVVSNPEFLREGEAVNDFMIPDRIVIGVDNGKAKDVLLSIYRPIERTGRPILLTDVKTSELIKYASNAMLAARISFMNELSHLCEKVGADIKVVARGIGLDSRIGSRFLQAGIGYGGSCFPKDVRALVQLMKENGCSVNLLESVEKVNELQKHSVVPKVQKLVPELKGKKIAIWGLSFKPKTDDMRDAPSIVIIKELQALGAEIHAFDPVSERNARHVLSNVHYADTPFGALEGAECLVIVTEWDLFRELDKGRMKQLMAAPNIVDGRNIHEPAEMRSLGFN